MLDARIYPKSNLGREYHISPKRPEAGDVGGVIQDQTFTMYRREGDYIALHRHTPIETFNVVKGRLGLATRRSETDNYDTHLVNEGETVIIAPDLDHALFNMGEDDLTIRSVMVRTQVGGTTVFPYGDGEKQN